ncbi:alpha/beta hydrolase [Streptomyces orinoci]|uniref:Alpha/beta hydrolase-fold protein n=1 Tax=Streptomyces orinoci TaxID=67339 RepID=A0ABV3K162_STRON|nr:alpha/beta hydrolase-fold protein [Streptomyces orinoci]
MTLSLTGTAFFALLVAVTVLAVLATLLLWARIPGPRPLRWLGRVLLIGLCQVTAICVVAVWINTSYGLYASWEDLLGRDGDTAGPVSMPGPPAQRAKFTKGDNGLRETYFHGARSSLSGQVMVWTPPQYDDPRYRKTGFPVVMLLHGVPGSPQSWLEQGKMPGSYRKLLREGTTRPFILAVPIINPGGVDTACSDIRGRKVATWLASDVPDLVRHHFRTAHGPGSWATLGISTGGFCAAKLPLQFPKVFSAGAALDPDPLNGDGGAITDQELRKRNSPIWLVRHTQANVALFMATSRQDRDSPPRYIEDFQREAVGSQVRLRTMLLDRGGHNYRTWVTLYPAAFAWLAEQLPGGPPAG